MTPTFLSILDKTRGHTRAAASVLAHALLFAAALFLALAVRFDLEPVTSRGIFWPTDFFLPLLPAVVGIKLLVFVTLRVHRGSWRYVSMPDLLGMLSASTWALGLTILLFYLIQYTWFLGSGGYLLNGLPETVFLLDWLFGLLLVGSARLFVRLTHEESGSKGNKAGGATRLLIIGAGDAAESVLRELARGRGGRPNTPAYRVVGLLDDSPGRQRTRIHGAPVLGTIADLPAIARKHQVGELLIALPSATKAQMQRIITLCRSTQVSSTGETGTENTAGIRFRIIPSFSELIGGGDVTGGRAALAQIRDVSVNDILGRDAVDTDLAAVGGMLHGKVVLVSGAGGSIGAEICRTIASFSPSTLVLLDKAENAIFEIERELRKSFPTLRIVPGIGDITDPVRVDQVFAEFLPAVVFHAAAHKHVPLAEANPGEAIRNNVFGTRVLADAAARHATQHFVMISTDKAVNPTSIMGATKRCAEIYIQYLSRRSATSFITVRFGNVLGSNGSVVPIFKQQIAAGGPVTVTHPEMRRYFMTIPEACQLVLQAGALGERGEIFVLDMGQPVRILDLARDLIILSGLRPEADIPIVFTGLRPGEKLFEELSIRGEDMAQTRHPKIGVWKSTVAGSEFVKRMLDELEALQHCTERDRVLSVLRTWVPEMAREKTEGVHQKPAANSDLPHRGTQTRDLQ